MKTYLLAAIIFAILIWAIYREGWNKCEQENLIKQSQEQTKVQTEINNDRKQIIKRKQVNLSVSTNDNLIWLQNNRCSDCKS